MPMPGLYFLSFEDDPASQSLSSRSRRALRRLAFREPFRSRLEARYDQVFASEPKANLFRGVYDTFEEAQRDAPPSKPVGYDNPGPAGMYRNILERMELTDYPVLFWIARALPGSQRLFDFGGHVGLRYYGFRSRLPFPDGFVWEIMDVPAVVRAGRELAAAKDATHLRFTERREDMVGADILYASGSLQYVDESLPQILTRHGARPRHIIIAQTAMHDGPAFYTLQSIGTAFCPYRIEDRRALIAGLDALGYERVDEWKSPEKICAIPFHPDRSVRGYDGLYFRARA
jgi:putative methyltransferase (TIGR04325 family)